jgi:drug/metabolite transporter (DMT)-like permease
LALTVFGAMLLSAFLHAAWNAWVKSRPDTGGALTALVIGAGFPNLIILAFAGPPAPAAWGWLACTVALSVTSLIFLARAYREGDFAVAYPLIRGLIPVVLAVTAVPLFGETPSLAGSLGVLCISIGLGVIAWEAARRSRTITLRGLAFAAFAATVTAASVMTDAKGARLAGDPFAYGAALAVANAIAMAAVQTARGLDVAGILVRHWPITAFATVLSTISYLLFMWSLLQAPVAMVAALRETSMLFALGIAATLLGERIGPWRWGAVGLMLAGMALIRA